MRRFIDNDPGLQLIQGVVVLPVPGERLCRYRINGRELARARTLRVDDGVAVGRLNGRIVDIVHPVADLPSGPCGVSDDTGVYGLFRVRLAEPDPLGRQERVWNGRTLRRLKRARGGSPT